MPETGRFPQGVFNLNAKHIKEVEQLLIKVKQKGAWMQHDRYKSN